MIRLLLAVFAIVPPAGPVISQPPAPAALRIAAASDLRFALDEVLIGFRAANPDLRVEAAYGSSGNFFAQIREGAPFDVFLSADSEYARRLFGEALSEAPFPYAIGRLALVVRKETGLDPKGFGDLLKSPTIRRIAIANPAHAPYGRAAVEALQTWRVHDAVSMKLVLGDSVAQAAQFMDSGAAQAAIVAVSLARARASDLAFAEIPDSAHSPLDQSGVILKRTTSLDAARLFQKHLTGSAGRAILSKHGFGLARP